MAFTTNDVLTKVRTIINDDFEPYRWSDEVLRVNLQTAAKRLAVSAPHTRYIGNDVVDFVEIPEDGDEPITIPDQYEEGLVYYVAHLCYLKDDPDTNNAELANAYFAKAERLMI